MYKLLSQEDTDAAGENIDSLRALLEKLAQSVKTAFGYAAGTIQGSLRDVQKTVSASGSALKRTVMSFDQLNRLKAPSGGGLSAAEKKAREAKEAAEALLRTLQDLGENAVTEPLANLTGAISHVTESFFSGDLSAVSYTDRIRTAMRESEYFTAMTLAASAAVEGMQLPMELAGNAVSTFAARFPGLEAAMQAATDKAGLSAQDIQRVWNPLEAWLGEHVIDPVGSRFQALWDRVGIESREAETAVESTFSQTAGNVASAFTGAWEGVKGAFSFGGNVFDTLSTGIFSQFKGAVNGLIDGINSVVSVPFTGLNSALDRLSRVDILGLRPFSGLSWRASVPRIPHLAEGAVLPANKPFLAMVGDQRSGTNVEAPLTTIQEALSLALEDHLRSNLAGHEATLGLLEKIYGAICAIEIGDTVIGRAYDRYARDNSVMGGGMYAAY